MTTPVTKYVCMFLQMDTDIRLTDRFYISIQPPILYAIITVQKYDRVGLCLYMEEDHAST